MAVSRSGKAENVNTPKLSNSRLQEKTSFSVHEEICAGMCTMGMLAVTKNENSLNAHRQGNESVNYGTLIQWNAIEQLKGTNQSYVIKVGTFLKHKTEQ